MVWYIFRYRQDIKMGPVSMFFHKEFYVHILQDTICGHENAWKQCYYCIVQISYIWVSHLQMATTVGEQNHDLDSYCLFILRLQKMNWQQKMNENTFCNDWIVYLMFLSTDFINMFLMKYTFPKDGYDYSCKKWDVTTVGCTAETVFYPNQVCLSQLSW